MICGLCRWCEFDIFRVNYRCVWSDKYHFDCDVYSRDVECKHFEHKTNGYVKWALKTDNNTRIKVISDCREKDCPHYSVKEKLREQYESELNKKNKGKRGVRK